MSYSTVADVLVALDPISMGQLTDDISASDIATERIDEAILAADSEIDGYIGAVTTLPLTTVPPLLGRLSVQMALYHLFLRRNRAEYRQAEYDNCRAMLRDIVAGRISLGLSSVVTGAAGVDYSAPDSVFTDEDFEGF